MVCGVLGMICFGLKSAKQIFKVQDGEQERLVLVFRFLLVTVASLASASVALMKCS